MSSLGYQTSFLNKVTFTSVPALLPELVDHFQHGPVTFTSIPALSPELVDHIHKRRRWIFWSTIPCGSAHVNSTSPQGFALDMCASTPLGGGMLGEFFAQHSLPRYSVFKIWEPYAIVKGLRTIFYIKRAENNHLKAVRGISLVKNALRMI